MYNNTFHYYTLGNYPNMILEYMQLANSLWKHHSLSKHDYLIIIFNICNYLGKVICSYPCWSRLELFMTLLLKQNGSLALALALFE